MISHPRSRPPKKPTRRQFLRQAAAAVSLAAAGSACSRPIKPRPPVLFIVIDDINDWVGHLDGHPQTRTPNLDRLAARGVAFTSAHCPAPVCNPSRTSVLTGIEAYKHRVFRNGWSFREVLPDVVTLPQCFQRAGYQSLGYGKIFHQAQPESWNDSFIPPRPRRYEPPLQGISPLFDWGPVDTVRHETFDGKVIDRAIEAMSQSQTSTDSAPLFLGVGVIGPHLPWHVPREHWDRLALDPLEVQLPPVRDDDLDDLPPEALWLLDQPQADHRALTQRGLWQSAISGYLAAIANTDEQLSRLLAAWQEHGYDEHGLIVVHSDHGWHLGEKQHWRKTTLWEESTRVPLVIAGGGLEVEPSVCSRPVSLVDVYPTLVELCDLDRPPVLHGASLVPLLRDPRAAWQRPAICTLTRHHAARSKDWRYIRYESGHEELYDHVRDPYEWHNVAAEPLYAEVKADLGSWLPPRDR